MQPQHRPHRNGFGLVQDFVEVSRKVRVEPPAKVSDGAEVSGFGLITGDSWIHGQAIVMDSPRIESCDVRAYSIISGSPYIFESLIDEHAIISGRASITQSQIQGTVRVHDDAVINRSIIEGNAMVSKNALVQNSRIGGNVIVVGGELHDVSLEHNERIHEGVWYRAPRHVDSPDTPMAMTECIHGKVIIGCVCRSANWWKQNDKLMQEKYGWTDEAVQWVWQNIDWVSSGLV
jgi:carbonic anhydrase/acetyltransferase-like protein (isoleucine patch superfamily)